MVSRDQVAGVAKRVKGSIKQAAGKATGNRQAQVEGVADKIAGKMQKAYGDVKEKVKKALGSPARAASVHRERGRQGRLFHVLQPLLKALVKATSPWSPVASPSATSMPSLVTLTAAKPPI
jgi:uncharacterized protein YjbJ (UPF0337 family)